jgi:signal transduction histidine kinase
VLVRRFQGASAPLRRVLAPVLAGAAGLALLATDYLLSKVNSRVVPVYEVALLVLSAVPISFLIGLLRARLARSSIGDLLVELREPAEPGALRDALARALRDPTLELAFWVPEYEAYVGSDGEPVELPGEGSGRVATFVERGGKRVAALVHDSSLRDEPQLVGAVTSAAGIALENERLQADLRARLTDLRASRSRIVEAGDAARRKLERDLHDGAQQRLVSLSILLRLVAGKLPPDAPETRLLTTARDELTASLAELRGIAQGIHPAVLSDHGLPVALESLAARAPVRIGLHVALDERLPEAIEVAAYYLVAEGLTNVAKYADAQSASIDIARENGMLVVEISDDGKGGADPEHGSGLRGLADRVEALDGRLRVWSPASGGTRMRAEIPCA